MSGHYKLRRGDEVSVYFINGDTSPYRQHGKYLSEDDEYVRIEGTVGDAIGHEIFIPKRGIKQIERTKERPRS